MKNQQQIVNSLRACVDATEFPEACKRCAYFTDKSVYFCSEELMKDATELIEQQQERIDIMLEGKEICSEISGQETVGETTKNAN